MLLLADFLQAPCCCANKRHLGASRQGTGWLARAPAKGSQLSYNCGEGVREHDATLARVRTGKRKWRISSRRLIQRLLLFRRQLGAVGLPKAAPHGSDRPLGICSLPTGKEWRPQPRMEAGGVAQGPWLDPRALYMPEMD